VDAVVIFDEEGRVRYPNTATAVPSDFGRLEPEWQEAGRLEQLQNHREAARHYEMLARQAPAANAAARAFQSAARCLFQSGQSDAVLELVGELSGHERYRDAVDLHGRLIVPNAELMALELMTDRNSTNFHSVARRLAARLSDYENSGLAAPQRRFLMEAVQRLVPKTMEFPTLAAERLAAEISANQPGSARDSTWQPGSIPNVWQLITPNRRVLLLNRADRIRAVAQAVAAGNPAREDHSHTARHGSGGGLRHSACRRASARLATGANLGG
jgi:hypothetical protein